MERQAALRYNGVVTMQKDPRLVAVGQRIRHIRKAKGFSQEAFAARAQLDRAYYGGIERGERNLAALNLIKIAATLGVEVGDLFPPMEMLIAKDSDTSG